MQIINLLAILLELERVVMRGMKLVKLGMSVVKIKSRHLRLGMRKMSIKVGIRGVMMIWYSLQRFLVHE
jgi:hypothetical protein